MYRVLIVGYGSIGRRHAGVLEALGCSVAFVTHQPKCDYPSFATLGEALAAHDAEMIVIANQTAQHQRFIGMLADLSYRGLLLVEKPLSHHEFVPPALSVHRCAVAYNLRFHPALLALRHRLETSTPIMVNVHAGQHLSEWRPGRDYRQCYSASASEGGGVLRDLSHELDYILWLFGGVRRVAALGGNRGVLGIASDEAWCVLLEMTSGAMVSLSLSYLERPARREIHVQTSDATLVVDMIAGTLTDDGRTDVFTVDRDATYTDMHRAMLAGDTAVLCSLGEGLDVLSLIAAIERAAADQCWQAVEET